MATLTLTADEAALTFSPASGPQLAADTDTPENVDVDAAEVGTSVRAARADHKHKLAGGVVEAQLSGSNNDYSPTGWAVGKNVLALDPQDNPSQLTGIAGGVDGRMILVRNTGSGFVVRLASESASSAAANRLSATASTIDIASKASRLLVYVGGTINRWLVV